MAKTKKDRLHRFFANLGNYLVVFLLKGISLLPFGFLYGLSDFFFLLNKYIFKYRYAVVLENLEFAFPEKSKGEIAQICDNFYHHFSDLTFEVVKLYNLSEKQLAKRISFSGLDAWERITGKHNGSIVLAYHYNNWEWNALVETRFKYPILCVYNPPRNNKPMEDFLSHSRGKWGGVVIRTGSAARKTLRYQRNKKPAALWLGADQSASASSPYWITFLNREAPFFAGPVRIAQKTNHPLFFQHIKKMGRGKYHVDYSLLIEEPAKVDEAEIVRAYVKKMEEHIKETPEYYLWSHRRWKHQRPEGIPLIK